MELKNHFAMIIVSIGLHKNYQWLLNIGDFFFNKKQDICTILKNIFHRLLIGWEGEA